MKTLRYVAATILIFLISWVVYSLVAVGFEEIQTSPNCGSPMRVQDTVFYLSLTVMVAAVIALLIAGVFRWRCLRRVRQSGAVTLFALAWLWLAYDMVDDHVCAWGMTWTEAEILFGWFIFRPIAWFCWLGAIFAYAWVWRRYTDSIDRSLNKKRLLAHQQNEPGG